MDREKSPAKLSPVVFLHTTYYLYILLLNTYLPYVPELLTHSLVEWKPRYKKKSYAYTTTVRTSRKKEMKERQECVCTHPSETIRHVSRAMRICITLAYYLCQCLSQITIGR